MYTLVPDAFIIGGGVAKAGDLLMKSLLANLRAQMFPLLMEDLVILPAGSARKPGCWEPAPWPWTNSGAWRSGKVQTGIMLANLVLGITNKRLAIAAERAYKRNRP